ncbi:MAG TPA: cation transporter [Permianibacter sp.]|nr:cation transporter [Permianibacter sp.]
MPAFLNRLRQRDVLWLAFALNASMFVAESLAGWWTDSASLLADSLDMFADAALYAVSLYALSHGDRMKANAALVHAVLHVLLAVLLLLEVTRCIFTGAVPQAAVMSTLSILALLVNSACVLLLLRFRHGDINLRASWLCSRNDLLGNVAVLIAAVLVGTTGSAWPDRVVGLCLASVMAHTAWQIGRDAWAQRRQPLLLPSIS